MEVAEEFFNLPKGKLERLNPNASKSPSGKFIC
jgi:hypothetical protein